MGYAKLIRDHEPSVFASYLVRIRVDPEKADPGYVGRIVESDVYKRFVHSRVGGAAQPNANAKVLSSFRLPIPEKHVQSRIASILSAYDDLIENNRRRIQLLSRRHGCSTKSGSSTSVSPATSTSKSKTACRRDGRISKLERIFLTRFTSRPQKNVKKEDFLEDGRNSLIVGDIDQSRTFFYRGRYR